MKKEKRGAKKCEMREASSGHEKEERRPSAQRMSQSVEVRGDGHDSLVLAVLLTHVKMLEIIFLLCCM